MLTYMKYISRTLIVRGDRHIRPCEGFNYPAVQSTTCWPAPVIQRARITNEIRTIKTRNETIRRGIFLSCKHYAQDVL